MCADDVQEPIVFSRGVSVPNAEERRLLLIENRAHLKLIRENSGNNSFMNGYDYNVVVIAYCIAVPTLIKEIAEPVAEEEDAFCGHQGEGGCFDPLGENIMWVQCNG